MARTEDTSPPAGADVLAIAGVISSLGAVLGLSVYAFAAHGFWAGFLTTLLLAGTFMVFGAGQSVFEAMVTAVLLAVMLGVLVPKARSLFGRAASRPSPSTPAGQTVPK